MAIKKRKLNNDKANFSWRGYGETQSVVNGVKETNIHIYIFIWKQQSVINHFKETKTRIYMFIYTHTYTYVYPPLYTNVMSTFCHVNTPLRCVYRS